MPASPFVAPCAAALAASFFLPWVDPGFGRSLGPADIFPNISRFMLHELPPEANMFLGSFAAAALVAFLGFLNLAPAPLTFLLGAAPFRVAAHGLIRSSTLTRTLGIPAIGLADIPAYLTKISPQLELGFVACFGSAAALCIASLMPGFR